MTIQAAPSQDDEQHVMTEAHTPTPWGIYQVKPYSSIVSPAGDAELGTWMVAERIRWDVDAAFIVRAVNAHDELVKALKIVQKGIRSGHIKDQSLLNTTKDGASAEVVALSSVVTAALSRAKGAA